MTSGRVSFVGAGPGAADLITLRGARRIAEADIVVWAASLVDPDCISEHARPEAELIDSSAITHEDVVDVYRRAAAHRLRVARVHSGDPSLWGAVQEQYDACQRLGIEVEIVPGVSAFSAAAAIAGRELTVPEVAQSVILTRLEGGKTPMPDGERIREFARHGTTMAVFLSAARSGQLVDELRAGGYADDTPVLIAYKATWPDELILHTTVGELAETIKQHKLWRHTLILVGRSLGASGTRSHLYNAGHFHTYRRADPVARRALRAARSGAEPATEPDEPIAATEGTGPEPKPKAGWSLHTSRRGWVAARVPGVWSGPKTVPDATPTPDPTPEPSAQAGWAVSAAAWSAVREWQETARSAGRPGSSRPRPAKPVADDQAALDLGDDPVTRQPEPTPEPVRTPVIEPVVDTAPDAADAPVREAAPVRTGAARSSAKRTANAKRSARKTAAKGGPAADATTGGTAKTTSTRGAKTQTAKAKGQAGRKAAGGAGKVAGTRPGGDTSAAGGPDGGAGGESAPPE